MFEEIGHMAGALSYQHVVIPLNLSSLTHQANSLEGVIQFYEDRIRDAYDNASGAASVYQPAADGKGDYARINGLLNTMNLAGQYNITNTHRQNLKSIRSRIRDLRELFPNVDITPEENARQTNRFRRFQENFDAQDRRLLKRSVKNRKVRRERRQRRFAFQLVSLISGIWGTYNGIYTRQQLDQLRRDLSKVEEQQDRLFAVTSAHQTAILQLDTAVSAILDSTLRHTANPSSVTDVTLQRLVDMLERNVGKAQRAIQAAQLRRLSVDFLTVDQLQDLHAKCLTTATQHNSKLIVEYPSDFFQVELSYVYTKDDVVLVLHVPMVPTDALLRLMRYRSFPIPLRQDDLSTGIIPRLDRDVLAISNGKERLSLEVKFSDLMECRQLNSIYLCDRHGVLDQSAGDSCIGALYSQHLDAALTLCPMEVVRLTEAVLPLSGNSFVILNNATGFNGQKDCVNGPSSELSLPKGITTQTLEPGCTLKLRDHVIYSDSSVHLKTDYHQYEWDWTAKITTITPDLAFLHEISNLQATSRGLLSLTDVIQTMETKQNRRFIWTLVYCALGIAGFAFFFLCILLNRSAVYYTRIFEGLNHLSNLFPDFGKQFLPRIPTIFRLMLGAPTTPAALDRNASDASV